MRGRADSTGDPGRGIIHMGQIELTLSPGCPSSEPSLLPEDVLPPRSQGRSTTLYWWLSAILKHNGTINAMLNDRTHTSPQRCINKICEEHNLLQNLLQQRTRRRYTVNCLCSHCVCDLRSCKHALYKVIVQGYFTDMAYWMANHIAVISLGTHLLLYNTNVTISHTFDGQKTCLSAELNCWLPGAFLYRYQRFKSLKVVLKGVP